MTIKEAVELYNGVNDKIADIHQLFYKVSNRMENSCGCYEVHKDELAALANYLQEYEDLLKAQLDEVFKQ